MKKKEISMVSIFGELENGGAIADAMSSMLEMLMDIAMNETQLDEKEGAVINMALKWNSTLLNNPHAGTSGKMTQELGTRDLVLVIESIGQMDNDELSEMKNQVTQFLMDKYPTQSTSIN